MARRFFFVSLGILALSIAYHLGVARATASIGSGQIVGLWGWHAHTASGEAWALSPSGWSHDAGYDLPVDVADVKFIVGDRDDFAALVTQSDEGWVHFFDTGWRSIGPFTGGPTAAQSASWGEVKARFTED